MDNSKHEIIFEEWKARLRSKNRDKDHVTGNFLELFEKLKASGVSFEEARGILPKALKAHHPDFALAKVCYRDSQRVMKFKKTEKEFYDGWVNGINDIGTTALYDTYQQEQEIPEAVSENTNKRHKGSIPEQEYRSLRKYADQFEIIDPKELSKQIRHGGYIPLDDEYFQKNILGDDDENK